jgi:Rod binding domain-containing protein
MTVQQASQKTDVSSLIGVGGVKPANAAAIQRQKLVEGAQSFEAMMMGEMLKPLQFGAGVEDGGEPSAGGAADTLRGMGTDALAKALVSRGGLGIARKIVDEVTAEEQARDKSKGVTKVV